jgi:hypothetical protein
MMVNMVKWLQILFLLFNGITSLYAQLAITLPVNNQVMQRNAAGTANIAITAYAHFPYSRITAFLTPVEGNIHKQKQLIFDQDQVGQGFLRTTINAETGWYQLKIIGYSDEGITDSIMVPRIGVGEVFLVTGNSNAMGLPGLGAKSSSPQVISMNMTNKTLNNENITVAPDEPMQLPQFEILKNDNYIFPNGETSWYWGELGEMLFKRWGTPVLFFNAAWAAANSENYRDAASGKDAYNLYVGKFWPNRQPYSNIINTVRYFASWTGMRAVLWSHGENDAQLAFKENDYFNYIRTLIENSRFDTGYNIPWFIARNSASNTQKDPYLPILNAQNRLTEIRNFNAFKGPYLDTIQIPRPVSGHFENVTGGMQGLTLAASSWNRSLADSTIKKTIAYQPAFTIHTGVTPALLYPGASFSLPFGTVGNVTGEVTFQAELLDTAGKFVDYAGTGTRSPLTVQLPASLPDGVYQIRVTATKPILPGNVSKEFYVSKSYSKIEFVNNIAARIEDEHIYVSWLIAADPSLKQMTLQKTTDGANYNDLQSFTSAGNVSGVYGYKDNNPGSGSIFYRLKMEYSNGNTAYSIIITLFLSGAPPEFVVFPNPVTNQQFYLKAPAGQVFQCSLFDAAGREHPIYQSDREAIGLITVRPFYPLPAGVYILKLVNETGSDTQRVLFR